MVDCYSGQEIYPNANTHAMGTASYGRTLAQVYLDFAFEFTAVLPPVEPIFSDYIWMTVQYCFNPAIDYPCWFGAKEDNKWTDGGW